MKRFLLAVALTFTGGALHAAVELSGVLTEGRTYRFVLTDGASSSGWLPLGGTFKGHEIIRWEPARSVLTVRKGEAVRELTLKSSRVVAAVSPAEAERQTQLAAAKRELAAMLMRYTEKHPHVIAQRRKIALLEKP